jgi:hypothetical protein
MKQVSRKYIAIENISSGLEIAAWASIIKIIDKKRSLLIIDK